jgi:hypothetical protein
MEIFSSIFSFFKKKEKYPYAPRVIENVILPAFFDDRKIDDVRLIDVDETNLKGYELFNFGENFVLYFENEISEESYTYIRQNYTDLRGQFYNKGRDFFYLPILLENIDFEILPALKSTFPFLSDNFNNLIIDELKTTRFDYDSILLDFIHFIAYKGDISKGCISSNNGYAIVERKNGESIEKFFDGYIENLNTNDSYSGVRFYSLKKDSEEDDNIKRQTVESLSIINNEIERLRKSGQLAILAPKIYDFLKKNIEGVIYNDTYPMIISEDFKILIPHCNNLEIKLSHLTKAIYLLFLSNHEPIDLKDLHLHKDRLLLIYKQVSNQNSYYKIKESVEDLLKEDNEAIYVHFSRIRKAFLTHFSQYIAFRYYITGDKGKPKKIMFDREEVTFDCKLF